MKALKARTPPAACIAVAVAVLAVDQLTKWIVVDRAASLPYRLPGGTKVEIFHNYGISFSLFQHGGALIKLLVAAITAVICVIWVCAPRRLVWPLALVVAGSVGNLVDRLLLGYVIDFLNVPHWQTMNIADAAIVIGALATAVMFVWQR